MESVVAWKKGSKTPCCEKAQWRMGTRHLSFASYAWESTQSKRCSEGRAVA
ncbi:hypothetical protein GQ600_23254 [Phytophthora cactorum]|nr:hypothetical protein GQ600_23254 [Phytophthora cactorum]